MIQIPDLTSLPLNLAAKKFTRIKFSNDKIYCNSYHRVPNIMQMQNPNDYIGTLRRLHEETWLTKAKLTQVARKID